MHQPTTSSELTRGDSTWRIGIVYSMFYSELVEKLIQGARETLLKAGISSPNILLQPAAGSFEIPLLGAALLEAKSVDALIGIGIIVEGETHHAELLARETARGIMDTGLKYRAPFAFEILYVSSLVQAAARASQDHNKGEEAAYAVLHSLAELKRIG